MNILNCAVSCVLTDTFYSTVMGTADALTTKVLNAPAFVTRMPLARYFYKFGGLEETIEMFLCSNLVLSTDVYNKNYDTSNIATEATITVTISRSYHSAFLVLLTIPIPPFNCSHCYCYN